MNIKEQIFQIPIRIKMYFVEAERQAQEAYDLRYKSSEAIAGFGFHRPGCTRNGPLEPVTNSFISVSGGGWGGSSYTTYTRCVECKGSKGG